MCKTVGRYIPASENQSEIIEREFYGQGMIFKDWSAFESDPSAVCYIPELSDSKYTWKEFREICGGNEELAKELFHTVDWQHPESLLEDWRVAGEIITCEKCGYVFDYDEKKCPKCGTEWEGDDI